ncbi:hypothetical protein E4U53_007321, partial [Claviceps sorghi]
SRGRGTLYQRPYACFNPKGVYLNYQAFDARNVTPQYKFSYGLSYTTFACSGLILVLSTNKKSLCTSASRSDAPDLWDVVATVQARVRNSGLVAGAKVAQLYGAIPATPPRQLRGFEKVNLAPDQDGRMCFALTKRDLSDWHVGLQKWVVRDGEYGVFIRANSRDIRLDGVIFVQDETSRVGM